MSQKQTLNSIALAVVLSMAVFLVALALFLVLAEYRIMSSLFLAFLVSFLAGIVLLIGFGSSGSEAAPAGARAAAPATPPAALPPSDDASANDAAEFKAAAEAEAARMKAAEEAAAAEAEAARVRAEQEQNAAAEAEAARQQAVADAEAARAAEAAAAAEMAPPAAVASTPDYDGDGVREGTNEGTRPAGLDGPRAGAADDLKQIKGIGPKLEKLCNRLGFWHFDQVAAWTSDEVAWVDANLEGFKGRVTRDEWVAQAKVLATGGETEFSKRVEDGDVY